MKILKSILAPFWKIWFVLVFSISFLILYPLFFITIKTKKLDAAFRLKRVWAYIITSFSGIVPIVKFENNIKKMPRPCIFVANHTSYLDIVLTPFYIDHLALFMGKSELLKAPLFRTFFKGMDIPVNRKSKTDPHRALVKCGEELDKNRSLVIYPEGTISEKGLLKTFKNGPFKLAIEKQVPIVPIVNLNNWELLQNGGFLKSNGRPGFANIIVLKPIETKGMTEENMLSLKTEVFNLINEQLIKYYGTNDRRKNS